VARRAPRSGTPLCHFFLPGLGFLALRSSLCCLTPLFPEGSLDGSQMCRGLLHVGCRLVLLVSLVLLVLFVLLMAESSCGRSCCSADSADDALANGPAVDERVPP
jgi:hypothetical protein